MPMREKINELIAKSGKHKPVEFKDKDKRKSFDENFGKDKIEVINKVLGTHKNRKLVLSKISGK
jgi:hypothetical protein